MMKPVLFACLPAAAIVALVPSVSAASDEDALAVPPASEFNLIQRYAISYDEPRDVAEFYLSEYGIKAHQADFQTVDHPTDVSMRIMLVTADGLKDNAVQGVQWRFEMRASKGSWEAVQAGMRRKCNRGENAGQWTRDVCP